MTRRPYSDSTPPDKEEPMAKFTPTPLEDFSREELIDRLRAAEDVCLMYGWSASVIDKTDRERATYRLWSRWLDIAGGYRFAFPKFHPHLSDEEIQRLADEDREIKSATMRKLDSVIETVPARA